MKMARPKMREIKPMKQSSVLPSLLQSSLESLEWRPLARHRRFGKIREAAKFRIGEASFASLV